ncbi:MAG: hypothetical protein ACYC51_06775, partial [Thermoleophilia bacterium]
GFGIIVDTGGQGLSGDLKLTVYPAASPLAPNAFATPPLAESMVQPGFSATGQARVEFRASVGKLKAGPGGFPVKVSLVRYGREVLAGQTWLAVVEPGAREPLDLVLLWAVGGPPDRDPQGEFVGTRLLERCQADPRSPDSLLQHLDLAAKYPRIRTTYAIEGSLLDQLTDMSDGFTQTDGGARRELAATSPEAASAAGCVGSLKNLARSENTEIVGTPYMFASLPVLARDGWDDGSGQYRIGHNILTDVLALTAVPKGSYIPDLNLTTDSLRYVAVTGGEYAVMAGSTRQFVIGRPQPGKVTFRLRDLSGERFTSFFANEEASLSLLGDTPNANAFFASLVNAFYFADPGRLVIAASPVSNPSLTASQRDQVYGELDRQSWVRTLTLGEAKDKYRPDTQPLTLQRYFDPLDGYISQTYYEKLSRVHELFEAYRLAVDTDEPELQRQVKNMYTAESEYFLNNNASPEDANAGLAYLDQVSGFVQGEISGLRVIVDTPWMQRAADGEATVKIINNNLYPFTVDLVLGGDAVDFPEGAGQRIRLQTGETEVRVPYHSGGWSHLTAGLESQGLALVTDSAGVRPVTTSVWIVLVVAVVALLAGTAYMLGVVRRR